MPYYRLIIWTRKRRKPFCGIRFMEQQNINAVQGMLEKKAMQIYHSAYVDCEVQMLSKMCTAVEKYRKRNEGK